MSDEDVIRAANVLKRHGLPVPMSDEAALTFITGFLLLESVWEEESSGDVSVGRYNPTPLTERDRIARSTYMTDGVVAIYKRICERLSNDRRA